LRIGDRLNNKNNEIILDNQSINYTIDTNTMKPQLPNTNNKFKITNNNMKNNNENNENKKKN
jgi:hypothetical protein